MMRKSLFLTVMTLCVAMMVPDDAFAQRRGGSRSSWGSSRSSSSRSRSTRSTPRRSTRSSGSSTKKTWGGSSTAKKSSSTTTTTPKKGFNTSKKKASSKQMSAADKKLAAKAKKSGTSYKSRKEAVSAFKQKNASKYPSKFTRRPATRPNYIPRTTVVNGQSVNVVWNPGLGGYAYMNALGTLVLYDAMADAMMRDRLMRNAGYYHPGMNTGPAVIHHHSGYGFFTFLFVAGGMIALVWFSIVLTRRTALN